MTLATDLIKPDRGQDAIDIHLVNKQSLDSFTKGLSGVQRASLSAQKFSAAPGTMAIVPNGEGWFAVGGVNDSETMTSWCLAHLAERLPGGSYRLANAEAGAAMYGWQTAQYVFDRYRKQDDPEAPRVLLVKEVGNLDQMRAEAEADCLVRDMVNTPAEDMGPAAIEAEAEKIAKANKADFKVIRGDKLETDYPMIHAVGRAAAREHAPRLIEINWGKDSHPRLAIVGKGVSFDSGGLDIKPPAGMLLMKKDMGGAAHALALAKLVMETGLKVRLQCLIPTVENAIAGNAFRPGDVLKSRKGLTVEIGNTDAEGRLILGDALALACESAPELIVDFATLTGAARVALGPDLPAMFAREDSTAQAFIEAGEAHDDTPWRLPLHSAYAEWLKSDIADMNNSPRTPFAGASIAALFLDRFVEEGLDWVHFDTFAWRPSAKPGRSKGGAALGLRASFHALKTRFG